MSCRQFARYPARSCSAGRSAAAVGERVLRASWRAAMVSCWDVIGVSCSWVWEERVKRGDESCIVFVLLGRRQSDGRNQLNPW